MTIEPGRGAGSHAIPEINQAMIARRRQGRRWRLLAWNIRQGGGSRLAAIAAALVEHDADILVLSEYRGGDSARRLLEMLAARGYRHATQSVPPPGRNGVLIAARRRFREHGAISESLPEPYKMLSVEFSAFRLCGIYMPNLKAKIPYWDALIAALSAGGGATLVTGDFNTGRYYLDEAGATFTAVDFMDRIESIGFCDLWRQRYPEGREYSWYSTRGNGFRLDHAFLSPQLTARAGHVGYSHKERIAGISDHSPLILDLKG